MGHLLFRCSLLLISLLIILHSLEGAVELSNFLPYGLSAGDTRVPTGDDNSAGPISFRLPFPFFEKRETIAFVNTNGAVSFGRAISQYTPTCGPMDDMSRMVAPFWADVDTNRGGDIYYRESNDPYLLELVSREVAATFPQLWGVEIKWLFITTWLEVAYYGCCSGCSDTGRRNNYQSILATDGTTSFAIFYFNKITWTTGTASGGNGCGLYGTPAKVGFDPGDSKNFYSVSASCTESILNIASMSNLPTPSPGKFVFRIDNANSIQGCIIANISSSVPLILTPTFVDFMGNRPVILSGPCINMTADASCTFYDPTENRTTVPARVMNIGGVAKAICGAPYFKRTGRTRVQLTIADSNINNITNTSNNTMQTFTGPFTVSNEEPTLQLNYDRNTSHVSLAFSWSPSLFTERGVNTTVRAVSIRLITFDGTNAGWKDALVVANNVSNSDGQVNATLVFGNVSWQVPQELVSRSFSAFRIDVYDPSSLNGLPNLYAFKTGFSRFFCGSLFFRQSNSERDKQCTSWYRGQSAILMNQTACPPLYQQALQDWRFEQEPLNEIGGIYRPNAVYSFRSRVPQEGTGYCQQCTYNAAGQLLVGPMDGGNLRKVHPLVDPLGHWKEDVVPFCDCCLELKNDRCALYYQKRPSHSGTDYRPPNLIGGSGDPHFTTLDGVQYTFNPVGEFWLIRQQLPGGARFEVQTRIEKYETLNASLVPLNASVFTAFVMRRIDASSIEALSKSVQVQRSQSTGLEVLIDGVLFQLESALNRSQRVDNFAIDVSFIDSVLRVRVAFDAGWALDFSSIQGALAYTVSASDENKNTPSGLLGNFNGNPDDDFTTPDGIRLPTSASLHDIHYRFGMTWNVSANDSLFSYPPGRNHSFYQNLSFVPSFNMPNESELSPEARAMCGSSRTCLFDVQATGGNLAFANNTVKQEERVKDIVTTLNKTVMLCPRHVLSEYAVVATSNGYFNGSVATLICTIDSFLNGNNVTICWNGVWSDHLGNCFVNDSPPSTKKPDDGIELFKPPLLFAFIGGIVLIILLILGLIAALIFIYRRRRMT